MNVDLETTSRGLSKVGDVLDSEQGMALLGGVLPGKVVPGWTPVRVAACPVTLYGEDLP